MKVSVLSKADQLGGGASKVAANLAIALRSKGIETKHFVGWGGKKRLRDIYSSEVIPLFGPKAIRIAIKCGLAAQWELGIPEAIPVEFPSLFYSGLLDADLIHVHDTTEVLSPLSMLWLSRRKPVIWTLHDTSAFTAGCISPFENEPLGCGRWRADRAGCDRTCPMRATKSYPFGGKFNGIPLLWWEKKMLAEHGRVHMTAPSRWLIGEVARSKLYAGRFPEFVSNGIDIFGNFVCRPKQVCKTELGLDQTATVITLISGDLSDLNKGFHWAVKALKALPESIKKSVCILCIGTRNHVATDLLQEFDVLWVGYVEDQNRLSVLLNAADLMIYPSMADNQPLAVIEALASGTPVFAFATGGIPEMLDESMGGIVARKDVKALAQAVTDAISGGRLPAMSVAARAHAERFFTRERMADNFIALYDKVLGKSV